MSDDGITVVIAVAYLLCGAFCGGILVDWLHNRKRRSR